MTDEVSTVYRTNTYPLVHAGFFHMFLNLLAVTPLLSGFEAEHGTLTSLSLFFGRKRYACPYHNMLTNSSSVLDTSTYIHSYREWHLWRQCTRTRCKVSTREEYVHNEIDLTQYLGIYAFGYGRCQDVQIKSLLYAWGHQDPYLDDSSCAIAICDSAHTQYESAGTSLWYGHWLLVGLWIPKVPRSS